MNAPMGEILPASTEQLTAALEHRTTNLVNTHLQAW